MSFIEFKQVKLEDVLDELMPIFVRHYQEIAHYKDIPLSPNVNAYLQADEAGLLHTYVAYHNREGNDKCVGYALYSIAYNPHYNTSLQAHQDIIYIEPENRGFGEAFINWCDEQLKDQGVQVVYHHVKKYFNFGPMLERNGYELIEHIYGKRLDK